MSQPYLSKAKPSKLLATPGRTQSTVSPVNTWQPPESQPCECVHATKKLDCEKCRTLVTKCKSCETLFERKKVEERIGRRIREKESVTISQSVRTFFKIV